MTVSALALFSEGCNEARMRDLYKTGTGQKLFSICKLNKNYPDLKIVDNILDGKIQAASLDRMEMFNLLKDEETTQADVEAYVTDPKAGKKVPVKMAEKKEIDTLSKQHPADVVCFVLTCVLENRLADLKKLIPYADELNKTTKTSLQKEVKKEEETVGAKS